MKPTFQKTLIAAAFLSTLAATASAATILIDFGKSDTGFQTTGNWNNFAEPESFRFGAPPNTMLTDMIDSDGNNTGVDLVYFAESNESNVASGVGGADHNVATSTGYDQTATRDTMFLNRGDNNSITVTMELRDLAANGLYDLSFFASVPSSAGARNDTTWTAGGNSVSINPAEYTGDVVTLQNVQANGSGVLQIDWSNNPDGGSVNDSAHWNTLEIVTVPEPSSLALVAVALGMLTACRRRAHR